jgi:hypothetical protein
LAIRRTYIKSIKIEELTVTRRRVSDLRISDSLRLPDSKELL